jgi:hypothetical protein
MKFRKTIWVAGLLIPAILLSSCNIGAAPPPEQDVGAIQTEAFGVVLTQAAIQQTQTALAIPPTPMPTDTPFPTPGELPTLDLNSTNTPFAFNTQQPGFTPLVVPTATIAGAAVSTVTTRNGCNDASFMGESGIKDGETIEAGKSFHRAFMLLNTGECTWDEGYSFAYLPESSTPGFPGYSIILLKNKPEDFTKPGHTQTYVLKFNAPKTPGTYKAYWKMKDDAGNLFGPLVWLEIIVK